MLFLQHSPLPILSINVLVMGLVGIVSSLSEDCIPIVDTNCTTCESLELCSADQQSGCHARLEQLFTELELFCASAEYNNSFSMCDYQTRTTEDYSTIYPGLCVDCIGANLSQIPCIENTSMVVLLKGIHAKQL